MEGYTVLSLFKEIAKLLQNDFPAHEIQSIQRLIFEKKLGLPIHKIYLNPDAPVVSANAESILHLVSELKIQKPIQYLLGEADFFGLKFLVTPDVLIPRQETEELVDWIVKVHYNKPISILDIGTGSGCIAITLSLKLPQAKVYAIDVSDSAIAIAKKNANSNNANVAFQVIDILDYNSSIANAPFDVVVSNPPYVREQEKFFMKPNVLSHEPHLALFVPNDDPLIFYRAIVERSSILVGGKGQVFCEINEALGNEVAQLFADHQFHHIELRKDLNGKDRMIKASRK